MAQSEDPLDGLEERLQSHTKAFESLLALTPAREYYGSQIDDGLDPSEQWNRKKQTKEQKRAAKKAKLDPANQKSALDVMKERELKRKRELGMEDDEDVGDNAATEQTSNKKQKKEPSAEDVEAKKKTVAEKRKEKRDRKKEKTAAKKAKQEAKKAKKQDADLAEAQAERQHADGGADEESEEDDAEANDAADLEKVDFSGLAGSDDEQDEDAADDEEVADASSVPTSPAVNSPAFDVATNHSEASSSSSITPPSVEEKSEEAAPKQRKKPQLDVKTQQKPNQIPLPKFDAAAATSTDIPSGTSSPKLQLPNVDQALLQERLRKRIEELRAKRKADGPDGKPAKSRQELLDQRRKKEEQRKAHKKELRREAKEAEERKREEQLRGSGSPATDIFERRDSPRPSENSFSFSRLAFEDGTAADASLSTLNDARKKKGPQDPKTALLAAQKKQARISGLDAGKKADIEEKDMWLNAKKRAHGERVRDDTSLLKKALKRKEKQKNKSEKEWKEREENITKAREAKQKKRETNLQKRRDEKGQKGKKKGGSSGGAKGKKKGRPGFEGRFKA
ncbi:Ribosomal RNA-processing protein 14 [Pseudocercospora fuligena]|uniref:Ribosomal RNA-processing protein 14 n=1 Tax=Pseudocercospora fuligena TaxID=685502 RepID=A0A8H6RGK4_9PEZI|nr:Ribosomal RNA-processing protein 14 [Pseudocercospora fuligena]